ncbi:hypothetical protein [Bradyrhizobium cosmicum]|uniref:hypothetical protein n=1 Tax=Bradyrhizobium cosmicum TaxID=1404864 RepID=UPI0028E76013|nr:hypothetical protein [Bradyrhizobium cosmicum]
MPQPKSKAALAMTRGRELKLETVARALPDRLEEGSFGDFPLQRWTAGNEVDQMRQADAYCLAHSKWRLSCKLTNIRHQMKILAIFCALTPAPPRSPRAFRATCRLVTDRSGPLQLSIPIVGAPTGVLLYFFSPALIRLWQMRGGHAIMRHLTIELTNSETVAAMSDRNMRFFRVSVTRT